MTDLMSVLKMHSRPNVQIPDSPGEAMMRLAMQRAIVEIERLRAAEEAHALNLRNVRQRTLEECARIAESKMDRTRRSHIIAAAIRALGAADEQGSGA